MNKRVSLKIRRLLEHISIKLARKVICVTDYVRSYAVRYGAGDRAEVIHNSIDLEQFSHSVSQDAPRAGNIILRWEAGQTEISGVLDQSNRLFRFRPETGFDRRRTEFNRLSQLASGLMSRKKSFFLRSVPHNRIQDYYSSSSIFAIATHYEGFCMPVIEAMACGIPVIASRIPPIEEVLGDAGC